MLQSGGVRSPLMTFELLPSRAAVKLQGIIAHLKLDSSQLHYTWHSDINLAFRKSQGTHANERVIYVNYWEQSGGSENWQMSEQTGDAKMQLVVLSTMTWNRRAGSKGARRVYGAGNHQINHSKIVNGCQTIEVRATLRSHSEHQNIRTSEHQDIKIQKKAQMKKCWLTAWTLFYVWPQKCCFSLFH